jgi:hypothetical protein
MFHPWDESPRYLIKIISKLLMYDKKKLLKIIPNEKKKSYIN